MSKEKKITVLSESLKIDNINKGQVIIKKWSSKTNKVAGELFFKASSDRPNHSILVASRFNEQNKEPNPPFPGWFLQLVGNKLSLGIGNGSTWKSVIAKNPIENNKLYHVAFSLNNESKTAELYLDGEKSELNNIIFKKPCDLVTIGALMPNGNFGFKGEIEDLRLGEILVENQEKKEINLKKSLEYLETIKSNLNNLNNDIESLQGVLDQINSWKIRGLSIDVSLLNNQIEQFTNKRNKFIENFILECNKLKDIDQKIRKTENILIDNNDIFGSYQNILENLLDDINILDSAVDNLSEFESLGVELGNAFDTIDKQRDFIKDTLINSEKHLKQLLNETFEMMNIITLNE